MSGATADKSRSGPAMDSFADGWERQGREDVAAAVTDVRGLGRDAFLAAGFPASGEEAWKYTSLRKLARRKFSHGMPCPVPDAADLDRQLISDVGDSRLVFINGRYTPELSAIETSDQCSVAPLAECLADADTLAAVGRLARPAEQRFAALNQSFLRDGVVIRTAAGADEPHVVYLAFLSIGGTDAVATHPRVIIEAASGSRLVVVEHYLSIGDNGNLTNAVTEIAAKAGSRVDHYRIQDESESTLHLAGLHGKVHADATLNSLNLSLGAALFRMDLHVDLVEPGADTRLDGLYMVSGRRHADNHTRVDHRAPETTSNESYRGVLKDRGRGVFNGKAIVHEDAQKIEAHQSNRNLLLSEQAEVDTKPELEIYADDVVCSHGATVGQLDEDSLFYLRSRGMGEDDARNLLTYAFAESVIERIELDSVRRRLGKAIAGEFLEQSTEVIAT